jgi:hypothetical protein
VSFVIRYELSGERWYFGRYDVKCLDGATRYTTYQDAARAIASSVRGAAINPRIVHVKRKPARPVPTVETNAWLHEVYVNDVLVTCDFTGKLAQALATALGVTATERKR